MYGLGRSRTIAAVEKATTSQFERWEQPRQNSHGAGRRKDRRRCSYSSRFAGLTVLDKKTTHFDATSTRFPCSNRPLDVLLVLIPLAIPARVDLYRAGSLGFDGI